MKNKIATLLLAVISVHCFSQETKLVTYGNNNFNKEFYVLKSDENVKHGSFLWYTFHENGINLLESGNYVLGKKDGQWDYFYSSLVRTPTSLQANNLRLRVFYKNGIKHGPWTSFHLDTIQSVIQAESHQKRKKPDSTVININLKDIAIRVSGQYRNDIRTGYWTAYAPTGEMVQRFDFDESQLLFDNSLKDSSMYNDTRPALFLGGENELRRVVFESLDPAISQRIARDSTRLVAEFIVKSDGTIDQLTVQKGKATKDLQLEITRVIQTTSGAWLPALNDGNPVDTRQILMIDVIVYKRKWNSIQFGFKISRIDQSQKL